MSVKLWLDDMRPTPEGWVRAKSVDQARKILQEEEVEFASLDHDLGIFTSDGGSGVKLTDWMAEFGHWPSRGIRVHSSNPSGVQAMVATIDRYGPYEEGRRFDSSRGATPDEGWPPNDRYV